MRSRSFRELQQGHRVRVVRVPAQVEGVAVGDIGTVVRAMHTQDGVESVRVLVGTPTPWSWYFGPEHIETVAGWTLEGAMVPTGDCEMCSSCERWVDDGALNSAGVCSDCLPEMDVHL